MMSLITLIRGTITGRNMRAPRGLITKILGEKYVEGKKKERMKKKKEEEYRVRQRGCSLTHSARTPPAVFRRN